MIATATIATKDGPGARWAALAVYPNGLRPERLELYPVANAGDGAEMTGIQVVDEFETMSGPVLIVPDSAMGLAYDRALTLAFERDGDLAVGSGWPPIVIGLSHTSGSVPRVEAGDLEPLFREPATRAWEAPAGGDTSFGYVSRRIGSATIEAFVAVVRGQAVQSEQCVGIVVTDLKLGPRDLRALAVAAHRAMSGSGASRRLALAISTADPILYKADPDVRRALDGAPGPAEAENAASLVTFAALGAATQSRA